MLAPNSELENDRNCAMKSQEMSVIFVHIPLQLSEPPDPSASYQEVGNNGSRVAETRRQTDGSRWRGL